MRDACSRETDLCAGGRRGWAFDCVSTAAESPEGFADLAAAPSMILILKGCEIFYVVSARCASISSVSQKCLEAVL